MFIDKHLQSDEESQKCEDGMSLNEIYMSKISKKKKEKNVSIYTTKKNKGLARLGPGGFLVSREHWSLMYPPDNSV